MTDLHWETVTPAMREVLHGVGQSALASRFYLAGGTGLALQLGHRRSIDLDFFSATDEVRPDTHREVLRALASWNPAPVEQAWGSLLVLANGLHVGFYGYGYPLLAPPIGGAPVPVAGLADIGLMKLDALATRASRKDFVDLYALSRRLSLRALLDLAPAKYPSVRDFEAMVVRRMVYFERAEQEEPPSLIQPADWTAIKAFFREQAALLARGWLEE